MAEKTGIVWTDSTWNPWEGCQKVGPGCDHCYAEARNARFGGGHAVNWGPGAPRRRTSAANWRKPLAWNAGHAAFFDQHGRRQRVFCASLADVFDNQVPVQWRMDLFSLISDTPNLDWLILTKRIGNVMPMCSGDSLMFDMICERVWLGATVVNQEEVDRDIPKLLAVPTAVRFLSIEPLLAPVDLCEQLGMAWNKTMGCFESTGQRFNRRGNGGSIGIDWLIVGGESGAKARPMHPDWARSLRDQCQAAGVPFLFKQWGEWVPRGPQCMGYPTIDGVPRLRLSDLGENGSVLGANGDNHVWMQRAGKRAAGRALDGREWNEAPT